MFFTIKFIIILPHQILGIISWPKNYTKIPKQSHISQLPKNTCYSTTTYKNHRQSTVEILKMPSMLDTYKKYSFKDNNLVVLYSAYMQKKRTCHTEQVPFTSILNFIRKPFLIYPCCLEQFLYDDIYISIYIKLWNFLCIHQIVTINLFAKSAKIIAHFSDYRI